TVVPFEARAPPSNPEMASQPVAVGATQVKAHTIRTSAWRRCMAAELARRCRLANVWADRTADPPGDTLSRGVARFSGHGARPAAFGRCSLVMPYSSSRCSGSPSAARSRARLGRRQTPLALARYPDRGRQWDPHDPVHGAPSHFAPCALGA